MSLIDQEYTRHPYYDSRNMVVYLTATKTAHQPQIRATPDAQHEAAGHGTRALHQQAQA